MTSSRRAFLAAGVTGSLALSAGCLDFVTGDGPLEFSSDRVAPTDSALEETGFDEMSVEEETFEETVEAGVEREVKANFWLSSYAKALEIQGQSEEATAFVAVSTPDMSVAGRSFNPIDGMDSEELLDEFRGQIENGDTDIQDIKHEETFSVSILDESRDIDLLRGQTEYRGEAIDIELVVASFAHEGDYLVLAGMYPEMFQDEGVNVEMLLESVEHPA
ncbi:hypothetical protein HALLA_12695 [Halostagnicola larsenii XH-48]|uniref:Uncharacterized protein n=1 Tax=Halostagnicola larsenii XH-48 TaxID=797299 RepID=W0JLA1_9EURY|nr:DUF6517 family protein [Halostagnicola larsenii]AHF99520.1 hypothetical protein HALLA_12695 [Halostagnicola larsenii XH-48]